MRVVTFNALQAGVMTLWVNTGDTFTFTCRIGKIRVATQTKLSATVNTQFFRLFRMVEGRSVAVLTGDYTVKLFGTNLDHLAVACTAVFVHSFPSGDSVFCWLLLPLDFIGLTMVGIHEPSFP